MSLWPPRFIPVLGLFHSRQHGFGKAIGASFRDRLLSMASIHSPFSAAEESSGCYLQGIGLHRGLQFVHRRHQESCEPDSSVELGLDRETGPDSRIDESVSCSRGCYLPR